MRLPLGVSHVPSCHLHHINPCLKHELTPLPLSSREIIGAYAQTELGHGSNVRGIELEATWDQNAKEFILHSPTLTASKWWNGTLGRTATHAVVIAQLLLPSDNDGDLISYGPHPFIVQVRDAVTHKPPSSIVLGDIGPKYGYVSIQDTESA
jgi:acyl-CoA oxidase